jgi:hypothetical protein
MRRRAFWLAAALGMVLGLAMEASSEIYLWTDERGVVHMTNQWAHVPEAAHSRVSVRQSSAVPHESTPAMEQAIRPVEPSAVKLPPFQIAPDFSQEPPTAPPSTSVMPYTDELSVLIPRSRPLIHHRKRLSPPFPHNVRLDPFDPNFVWVGPNRVPKDDLTYPRVSLDTQAQFRNRLRTLERGRAAPHKNLPTRSTRR